MAVAKNWIQILFMRVAICNIQNPETNRYFFTDPKTIIKKSPEFCSLILDSRN